MACDCGDGGICLVFGTKTRLLPRPHLSCVIPVDGYKKSKRTKYSGGSSSTYTSKKELKKGTTDERHNHHHRAQRGNASHASNLDHHRPTPTALRHRKNGCLRLGTPPALRCMHENWSQEAAYQRAQAHRILGAKRHPAHPATNQEARAMTHQKTREMTLSKQRQPCSTGWPGLRVQPREGSVTDDSQT